MKRFSILMFVVFSFLACNATIKKETVKNEILQVEKTFEKMCGEKGIAEAFYFFADTNATILRQNDTLIVGNENIKQYYNKEFYKSAKVSWTPDFIDVSDDGTMAYTYGKYLWISKDESGKEIEFKGVFHTVWKKQKDNSWKYVWD